MSIWHIAWSYLWNRKLTTAMTIISVGLGVGLISTVETLREETERRFAEEGQAFDLVVGAKGNPLQLVLSTVYFIDTPTGNINWSDYERLLKEEEVKDAFPVSIGDNYAGYRIIGTEAKLFDFPWGSREHSPFELAEGNRFSKPMEAVLGAAAAEGAKLKIGDTFSGAHGLTAGFGAGDHAKTPYTVVGILKRSGTPNDRAIFCDIRSTWMLHAHEDDEADTHEGHNDAAHDPGVTAVLVKLYSPALRFDFKPRVNKTYNAMAAVPVTVIQKLYEQVLGTARMVLMAIGYLVVVISAFSIMIGLYMSILQRKRDLAVMRALGASRGEIFGSVIVEAFWVTVLGLGVGWLFGTVACYVLGAQFAKRVGLYISAVSVTPDLITAYSAVVLVGLVAGILPAWQAYRTDVARDLAEL
ncbi:MAG: FtsX-like permease family protein [Nitrospiraceae bacterium]|nr:FtsX-like permease family protein [Nitrospiraceae bacterium]